jgi:hypothetical protein
MNYYIKGMKDKEEFYYNGSHKPYNIRQIFPSGFSYDTDKRAIEISDGLNKQNEFTKIIWFVVLEKEFKWDQFIFCKRFCDKYEKDNGTK